MSDPILHKKQKDERTAQTEEIVNSTEKKRLIVSGPGTGKTFIFEAVIKKNPTGKKLVLTFIRRLVSDIDQKIQLKNTCKTFHEFAKGLLHNQKGSFDLQPYLSDIIKRDAELLGLDLQEFDTKFQELDEYGSEIPFYIKRGDYYNTVSFNDSVYRIFKMATKDEAVLPEFTQIIVDEYQDFNKLEIELIKLLEKRGPILIAGDDDQALYDGRSASSKYIKELYRSGRFKVFKPKYCSRCTLVIVNAMNAFIKNVQRFGFFKDRIEKNYECYLPDKENDSVKHQKVDFVECSTIKTVAKYVRRMAEKIDVQDIQDSHKGGYPTILIIGPSYYLRVVYEELQKEFANIIFTPSEEFTYSLSDAYRLLLADEFSNMGWRILAEFSIGEKTLADIIAGSENATPIIDLLPKEIISTHQKILEIIKSITNKDTFKNEFVNELKKTLPNNYTEIIENFRYKDEEPKDETQIDKTKPSILLTSYKGAKGLSGGHVFLLGAHNGSLPKNKDIISDVEISQFLVAMTRTRKKLFLVSNRWYINPMTPDHKFIDPNERSIFIDWIPNEFLNNVGYLKSDDVNKL